MRPRFPIGLSQLTLNIHTGEVQQRVLVIRCVIRLDLEVVSGDAVESRVDQPFDRILLPEESLAFVQRLLARREVAEEELGIGDGGEGEGVGLGDGTRRDCGAGSFGRRWDRIRALKA